MTRVTIHIEWFCTYDLNGENDELDKKVESARSLDAGGQCHGGLDRMWWGW